MPADPNLLPDDMAERRASKAERSEKAAPTPAMVDAEDLVRVLTRQRAVNEARPLPERVRTKIRVQQTQHGCTTLTFGKDEVCDPRDAGRPFKFGQTVYLKRDAFLKRNGTGMIVRGD